MSTATEILEQFFAAINRNDMQAIIRNFDRQIVRIEPEGFPTAGTYRGGRFADGFVFRDDKIVEYRSFGERAEALKWAGIDD